MTYKRKLDEDFNSPKFRLIRGGENKTKVNDVPTSAGSRKVYAIKQNDGNTLFRSLAKAIDDDEDLHNEYRSFIAEVIGIVPHLFKNLGQMSSMQDIITYSKKIQNRGVEGSIMEIIAFSVATGFAIKVNNFRNGKWARSDFPSNLGAAIGIPKKSEIINLHYDGKNYSPFVNDRRTTQKEKLNFLQLMKDFACRSKSHQDGFIKLLGEDGRLVDAVKIKDDKSLFRALCYAVEGHQDLPDRYLELCCKMIELFPQSFKKDGIENASLHVDRIRKGVKRAGEVEIRAFCGATGYNVSVQYRTGWKKYSAKNIGNPLGLPENGQIKLSCSYSHFYTYIDQNRRTRRISSPEIRGHLNFLQMADETMHRAAEKRDQSPGANSLMITANQYLRGAKAGEYTSVKTPNGEKTILQVHKDENCLFRSLSQAIEGTDKHFEKYRSFCCEVMWFMHKKFTNDIAEENRSKRRESEADLKNHVWNHVQKMTKKVQWGTNAEIKAFVIGTGITVRLCVCVQDRPKWIEFSAAAHFKNPLKLLNNGIIEIYNYNQLQYAPFQKRTRVIKVTNPPRIQELEDTFLEQFKKYIPGSLNTTPQPPTKTNDRRYSRKNSLSENDKQIKFRNYPKHIEANGVACTKVNLNNVSKWSVHNNGAGECLFRSLSQAIEGHEHRHPEYRQFCCKAVRKFAHKFLENCGILGGMKGVEKHVKAMEKVTQFGTNVEIIAFCAATGYSVDVWVDWNNRITKLHLESYTPESIQNPLKMKNKGKITLFNIHEQHFQLVVDDPTRVMKRANPPLINNLSKTFEECLRDPTKAKFLEPSQKTTQRRPSIIKNSQKQLYQSPSKVGGLKTINGANFYGVNTPGGLKWTLVNGGQGSCLFRSLSQCFEGHENLHRRYRQFCCDVIQQFAHDFEAFLEPGESLDSHLAEMRHDRTMGTHTEMFAFYVGTGYQCNVVLEYASRELRRIVGTSELCLGPNHISTPVNLDVKGIVELHNLDEIHFSLIHDPAKPLPNPSTPMLDKFIHSFKERCKVIYGNTPIRRNSRKRKSDVGYDVGLEMEVKKMRLASDAPVFIYRETTAGKVKCIMTSNDNDSLFRALSQQLEGHQALHKEYRNLCADVIDKYAGRFLGAGLISEKEHHAAWVREGDVGHDAELVAFCVATGYKIRVCSLENCKWVWKTYSSEMIGNPANMTERETFKLHYRPYCVVIVDNNTRLTKKDPSIFDWILRRESIIAHIAAVFRKISRI